MRPSFETPRKSAAPQDDVGGVAHQEIVVTHDQTRADCMVTPNSPPAQAHWNG
jgi:hypothetical protein